MPPHIGETAVVILNWNGKALLEKFLPGVIRHSAPAAVYVIDNASSDDSVRFLEAEFPEVRIIRNGQNYGFAGGYNEGLKQIEAEYYVLLNSDVEVTPDWIPPVISMMQQDTQIAACQPKLLDYAGKHLFEYAGAAGGYIDRYGFPFCRGRIFGTLEPDTGQYEDTREIFWASGACMFVRASVFRELGGFDAELFAHMEEIDLCWRMKNQGYKVLYTPASTVYHVGGGTLHKSNPRKTYLNFRNNLLMLYKNSGDFNRILLPKLLLDGIAGLRFLTGGSWADCSAIVKAHFYFYRHSRRWRTKRKEAGSKLFHVQVYPGSIVLDYFVKKKKKFTDLDWKG
jgi:GT2 family glycosyltransferase